MKKNAIHRGQLPAPRALLEAGEAAFLETQQWWRILHLVTNGLARRCFNRLSPTLQSSCMLEAMSETCSEQRPHRILLDEVGSCDCMTNDNSRVTKPNYYSR